MRALVVQQPWASLIADGTKTLEVRSWSTSYRGPVAIVAGRRWSNHDAAARWLDRRHEPVGVVAVVDLADVRLAEPGDEARALANPAGLFVWELRLLGRPRRTLEVKGQLALFRPPVEVVRKLTAERLSLGRRAF